MVLEFEIFILLLLYCFSWFPFPVFVLIVLNVFTNFCSVFLFACIARLMGPNFGSWPERTLILVLIFILLHEPVFISNTLISKAPPYNKTGVNVTLEKGVFLFVYLFWGFGVAWRLICFRFRVGLLVGGGLGVGKGLGGASGRCRVVDGSSVASARLGQAFSLALSMNFSRIASKSFSLVWFMPFRFACSRAVLFVNSLFRM